MERANRLIEAKSPYLLQHAANPVHWQPWDTEALAQASREPRPIFLSLGYSTCHWCHVMAHESFEDPETARLLNEHFVSIKVDREERPDLDLIYLSAVQLLTGSGGWPLSVFLLPDGRPFAGGTYFTPGRFRKLLNSVTAIYRDQHEEVDQTAQQVAAGVAQTYQTPRDGDLSAALTEAAAEALVRDFDALHGGLRGAPKFPPHSALALLLHGLRQRRDGRRLDMVTRTLDAMALGGLHDHLGGGFHRYATDVRWTVPHFEKMLYDNALLSQVYLDAYALTRDPSYREVAEGVYAWVAREMTDGEGGFYSGIDADSEGVEGKFYTWTQDALLSALGPESGELFCQVYSVEERGNFRDERTGRETGRNLLYLKERLEAVAEDLGMAPEDLARRMLVAREKLRRTRELRVRPHLDDKVLTSWNGLMIASLARAGRILGSPHHTHAAARAAAFLRTHLWQDGLLLRRWREGEAGIGGFLDDYAYLANGLLELLHTTGDEAHLAWARELLDTALTAFRDRESGGFWYTRDSAEPLFTRPKEVLDHPLPSSNGVMIQSLLQLAALSGEARYADEAEHALRTLAPWISEYPRGTESLALAIARWAEGGAERRREAA
jgi:uncharacterized protein YyaL (SSP411 family)